MAGGRATVQRRVGVKDTGVRAPDLSYWVHLGAQLSFLSLDGDPPVLSFLPS
jgi:hypothetical protein